MPVPLPGFLGLPRAAGRLSAMYWWSLSRFSLRFTCGTGAPERGGRHPAPPPGLPPGLSALPPPPRQEAAPARGFRSAGAGQGLARPAGHRVARPGPAPRRPPAPAPTPPRLPAPRTRPVPGVTGGRPSAGRRGAAPGRAGCGVAKSRRSASGRQPPAGSSAEETMRRCGEELPSSAASPAEPPAAAAAMAQGPGGGAGAGAGAGARPMPGAGPLRAAPPPGSPRAPAPRAFARQILFAAKAAPGWARPPIGCALRTEAPHWSEPSGRGVVPAAHWSSGAAADALTGGQSEAPSRGGGQSRGGSGTRSAPAP